MVVNPFVFQKVYTQKLYKALDGLIGTKSMLFFSSQNNCTVSSFSKVDQNMLSIIGSISAFEVIVISMYGPCKNIYAIKSFIYSNYR